MKKFQEYGMIVLGLVLLAGGLLLLKIVAEPQGVMLTLPYICVGLQSKARAYDMMIFVFGALMISLALMKVDLSAVLLLVFAYLFVIGYGIYWRSRLEKEM